VASIASRNEFYTSYTPYQPEVSQGMLQALYEYQSLMAELVALPIVNASMYDWSTAASEAMLMCARVTKRSVILVPHCISPERLQTMKTYADAAGIAIRAVPMSADTGTLDRGALGAALTPECACVYIENPTYHGVLEANAEEIGEMAHKAGALFCVGIDPVSCGVLRSPGDYGADIVVGEAGHLGNPLSYGGPLLGLFAIRDERSLLRMLPGRIVGATTDREGRAGYVMTLQTREQHIRRERATSNICTNESLCAVSCAAYLSYLGPSGIRDLARTLMSNAAYLARALNAHEGWDAPIYDSTHFREFVARSPLTAESVEAQLLAQGIAAGIPVGSHEALYCVTDRHTVEDAHALVAAVGRLV
jgi:glycine dehydrogenase subunit 1